MTNKNKPRPKQKKTVVTSQRINALENKLKSMTVKASKPFSAVGSHLGGAVGSLFGKSDFGKNVGKWLGSGIGSIFGSGDYMTTGPMPSENVFGGTIPKFSTTHASNIVCHREYIGDVLSTTAFSNSAYPIQPGLAGSFPWAASVASAYQEYRIHGLVYEFIPLTTDYAQSGIPGYLVMATNYNADSANYTTKSQMENSEFAVSVKPTAKMIHMVECAPQQTQAVIKYVREGPVSVGQDFRLYDHGLFQIATGGAATSGVVLGELWVSYCIEFLKPILSPTSNAPLGSVTFAGIPIVLGSFTNSSSVTNTYGLDTIGFTAPTASFNYGTANSISVGLSGVVIGLYQFTFCTTAAIAATGTVSVVYPTNTVAFNLFGNGGYQSELGASSTFYVYTLSFQILGPVSSPLVVTFGGTNWSSGNLGTLTISRVA
jgi:hypothetical protein